MEGGPAGRRSDRVGIQTAISASGLRLEGAVASNGIDSPRKVEFERNDSDIEYSASHRKSNMFETYERVPSSMKTLKSEPNSGGRSWVGLLKPRNSVSPTPRKMSSSRGASPIPTVRDERPGNRTFWFRRTATPGAGVEIWPGQHKPRVLYASAPESFGKNVETAGIGCHANSSNVVCVGDPFHITVEGFYVTPHDFVKRKSREMFLYSVQFDRHSANQPAILKVCYDSRSREVNNDDDAYSYTTLAAPGKLLLSSDSSKTRSTMDIHLRLLQVEDTQQARKLLTDVSKLNENVVQHLNVTGSKAVLTEVLGAIGSLSQGVIDRLGETEHVLNADAQFKLRQTRPSGPPVGTSELDSYLRYGVYYFLRRASRARLYSQASTMENARLMVRLTGDQLFRPEYAEFAETDYIAIRVHRGAAEQGAAPGASLPFVDELYAQLRS